MATALRTCVSDSPLKPQRLVQILVAKSPCVEVWALFTTPDDSAWVATDTPGCMQTQEGCRIQPQGQLAGIRKLGPCCRVGNREPASQASFIAAHEVSVCRASSCLVARAVPMIVASLREMPRAGRDGPPGGCATAPSSPRCSAASPRSASFKGWIERRMSHDFLDYDAVYEGRWAHSRSGHLRLVRHCRSPEPASRPLVGRGHRVPCHLYAIRPRADATTDNGLRRRHGPPASDARGASRARRLQGGAGPRPLRARWAAAVRGGGVRDWLHRAAWLRASPSARGWSQRRPARRTPAVLLSCGLRR